MPAAVVVCLDFIQNFLIFFLFLFKNIFVKWENIIISVGQDKITNESLNKRQQRRQRRRLSRKYAYKVTKLPMKYGFPHTN